MTRILTIVYLLFAIGYCAVAQFPILPTINHQPLTNYFTVSARDTAGRLSSPSTELAVTRPAPFILGWNPSATPGVAYTLFHGRSAGKETNALSIGTNLSAWWPGPPRSNIVLTILADPLILTNPPASVMFFALCATTNLLQPFKPIGHVTITSTNYP